MYHIQKTQLTGICKNHKKETRKIQKNFLTKTVNEKASSKGKPDAQFSPGIANAILY